MNNNVSRKLTSLKWKAKNTYLGMPARRPFYPPSIWRTEGPDPIHDSLLLSGFHRRSQKKSDPFIGCPPLLPIYCSKKLEYILFLIDNQLNLTYSYKSKQSVPLCSSLKNVFWEWFARLPDVVASKSTFLLKDGISI